MPAVTLGFEEIEHRLRALRRRVNLLIVQQVGYVSLSVISLAAATVVVTALRASPRAFELALVLGAVVVALTIAAASAILWRRWCSLSSAAQLADREGALQDRIRTLLAVRGRRPAPRLAPLLLAESIALGSRWDPRRLVRRRVSRLLYLLVTSVAALVSTAFLSPQPPAAVEARTAPPRYAGMEAASALRWPAAPVPGQKLGESVQVDQAADSSAVASGPSGEISSGAARSRPMTGKTEPTSLETLAPDPEGDTASGHEFSQRLQELIRQALDAQPMGKPQQLAQRAGGGEGQRSPDARDQKRGKQGQAGSPSVSNRAREHDSERSHTGAAGERQAQQRPDGSKQAEVAPDPSKAGRGSSAGGSTGSGGLLALEGEAGHAEGARPKTFKVTLTSFLEGASTRPAEPPAKPRRRVSDQGFAPSEPGTVSLSEEQADDDLLRKGEIPPEFEEIVREVFSQRP
jgi:hypothetical protein